MRAITTRIIIFQPWILTLRHLDQLRKFGVAPPLADKNETGAEHEARDQVTGGALDDMKALEASFRLSRDHTTSANLLTRLSMQASINEVQSRDLHAIAKILRPDPHWKDKVCLW